MVIELKTKPASQEAPIYRRIEQDLRSRVQNREWSPSEMLPSRRDMAIQYGVDVNTFQRAILPLLEEGVLRADSGRGTFVAAVKTTNGKFTNGNGHAGVQMQAPNADPQRLLSMQGYTAAIITGFPPEDDWITKVVNSFEMTFSAHGGQTKFFNILKPGIPVGIDPWIPMKDAVDSLFETPVDALVHIALYDRPNELAEVQKELTNRSCHLVYVGWDDVRQPIRQVFYDNQIAGYQAAKHLFEIGYRRITFFAPVEAAWVEERLQFAIRAAVEAGLPESAVRRYPEGGFVYDYTDHVVLGETSAAIGFEQNSFEDAIICANDRLAVGLIHAAAKVGKRPGKEFSVIGFDDAPMARVLGLSTLRPPLEALGAEAARLVERAISGDTAPVQIRLSSHLVLRGSTSSRINYS